MSLCRSLAATGFCALVVLLVAAVPDAAVPANQPAEGEVMVMPADLDLSESQREDLLEAREKLEKVLEKEPGNEEALRELVMVLFELGEYAEAVALLEAGDLETPEIEIEALPIPDLVLPSIPEEAPADLQAAKARYEAILKEKPEDEEALRGLVSTLFEMGEYGAALQVLEKGQAADVVPGGPQPAPMPVIAKPAPPPVAPRPVKPEPPAAPVIAKPAPPVAPKPKKPEPPPAPVIAKPVPPAKPEAPRPPPVPVVAKPVKPEPPAAPVIAKPAPPVVPKPKKPEPPPAPVVAKPVPKPVPKPVIPSIDVAALEKELEQQVARRAAIEKRQAQTERELRRRVEEFEEASRKAAAQLEAVTKNLRAERERYEHLAKLGAEREAVLKERVGLLEKKAHKTASELEQVGALIAEENAQAKLTEARGSAVREKLAERIAELEEEVAVPTRLLEQAQDELVEQRDRYAALEKLTEKRREELQGRIAEFEKTIVPPKAIEDLRARLDQDLVERTEKEKQRAAAVEQLRERIGKLENAAEDIAGRLESAKEKLLEQQEQYAALGKPAVNKEAELLKHIARLENDAEDASSGLAELREELLEELKEERAKTRVNLDKDEDTRSVEIDPGTVLADGPRQIEANIDRLIGKIARMNVNTVYLRACADADDDGSAESAYFPTEVLPVKIDLLGKVTAKLRSEGVAVYAVVPTLAVHLPDQFKSRRLVVLELRNGVIAADTSLPQRLSPFSGPAQEIMMQLYEDLAVAVELDGVLFADDGFLTDSEDFSHGALEKYEEEFGLSRFDPSELTAVLKTRWMHLKTKQLDMFIWGLMEAVKRHQPNVRFARAVYAPVLHNPRSERWLAQNYEAALKSFDRVVITADAEVGNVLRAGTWLAGLVQKAAEHPQGLEKTVFSVPARDTTRDRRLPEKTVAKRIRRLLAEGARHVAYGPDHYEADSPGRGLINAAMSAGQ